MNAIVLGAIVISNYPQLQHTVLQMKDHASLLLPDRLAHSTIVTSFAGANYVSRPELEKLVRSALTSPPRGSYFIVYGDKGVGKSEIVTHVAIGQKGVVKINVDSVQSKDDIVMSIFKKLKVEFSAPDLSELVEEMKKVSETGDNKIYPTIIFDLERRGASGYELGVEAARSAAKALAEVCRCIIILSEANAVRHFGEDDSREEFIFVGDLTRDEAVSFLQKRGLNLEEEEIEYIIENIGAYPSFLVKLVTFISSGGSVQNFVDRRLVVAEKDLLAFPLKTILQALKDHPEGVPLKYFDNQEEKGVDLSNPKAVGKAMKDNPNPIMYRTELVRYELLSRAHQTALKSYNPIPSPK